MFTQTAPFAERKSWKAAILFQRARHGGGGAKVEPTLAETGTNPAQLVEGWAGFVTNCDRLAQTPSRFMLSFLFLRRQKTGFTWVVGLNIPIRYRLRQSEAGSRHGEGARWGIAWRWEKKRYDCSRAIQNHGFAAQVSGACGELMQRGRRSARGRGREARKRSYGKLLAVSKLRGFFFPF